MPRYTLSFAVAAGLLVCPSLRAQDAKPAPEAKPVPAVSTEEVKRLIKDLGDDSFETREKATRRLIEIGKPALDAVKEAQSSKDAEVRSRAGRIMEKLDPKPVVKSAARDPNIPQIAPGGIRVIGPGQIQLRVQVVGGAGGVVKEIQVNENGRKIHITENADGIKVVVTDSDPNGKETTKEYKAKNLDELKKNHPEAAELYNKHAGGVQLNIGGAAVRPARPQPRNNPQFEEQKKKMEELLKKLGPQGEEAVKRMKELEEIQKKVFDNNNIGDIEKLLEELLKAAGQPGAVRPVPPAEDGKPRLGIEVAPLDDALKEELKLDHGLVVRRVLAGSRAEKLGLKENDVIQKANGRKIEGVEDIRKAVEENKKVLLEGVRDGKPFKAEEKE